jgi:predicted membrane protein DUF2207
MILVVRPLVIFVFGLVLVSGCGSDDDGNTAADSPSSSVATSPAAPESTGTADANGDGDPIDITLYDADFTVNASGDLAVVEALSLDVLADDRHGIYRTFDLDVPVEGFTATLDGSPTPISDVVENGQTSYQIGDPDRTLEIGEHSIRIEYAVADVLTSDGAGDPQFDWSLIPEGWATDILAAELSVDLPAAATTATCTIGDAQPCTVSGVGTRTLVIETGELGARTPVRLLAVMSSA